MSVGLKVTLRGDRMYEFYDKFVSIALPRMRDFRGVNPDSFDGRGNYALGVKEQLIFPEISYDQVGKDPRFRYLLRDHGKDGRRGERASRGAGHALQEIRRRTETWLKKSMINKQQRTPKFSTRAYTRCSICGRPHAVLRKYGICRICFRNLAYKGQIPGVKKASW